MADKYTVAGCQGRLQVDSASQISLQRYDGKDMPLKIAGVWEAKHIPASGPTLSNSGLSAATLYYIYAYDSSGTLTLEASTTASAVDADTGLPIKSGDASRLLLGAVYMGAGSPGTFVDSVTQRFLYNHWNKLDKALVNSFTANRTTTSGSFTEINTEIRIEMVSLGDEAIEVFINGTHANGTAGQGTNTGISEDGSTTPLASVAMNSGVNGASHTCTVHHAYKPATGYHYYTLIGKTSGGSTGTWTGGADETTAGRVHVGARFRG
jgi:hypothetical protein